MFIFSRNATFVTDVNMRGARIRHGRARSRLGPDWSASYRSWLSRASGKVPLSTVQFLCYVYAVFFLADGKLAIFFFLISSKSNSNSFTTTTI